MKNSTFLATLVVSLLVSTAAFASVTVAYYNEDSTKYEWPAVCSGSHYTAVFESSRTSTYTIQGSGPCVVTTPNGEVTFKEGAKIHIKNGKVIFE